MAAWPVGMDLDGANRNGEGGVCQLSPRHPMSHRTSLIAHASQRRLSAISIPILARDLPLVDDTVDTTAHVQHKLSRHIASGLLT